MKKVSFIGAACAVLLPLFFSCANEGNTYIINQTVESKGAGEESDNFVTEVLAVYAQKEVLKGSMYVRFYEGDGYVPYVGLRYFLKGFSFFPPSGNTYADGKYTVVVTLDGEEIPIVVDVRADTIYCPEYSEFLRDFDNADVEKRLLKMVRTLSGDKMKAFDLAKYGFRAYGSVNDVYVPLCIATNLFSCRGYEMYLYNGAAVYYASFEDNDYYDGNECKAYAESDWYKGGVRPAPLVNSSYNLLAFIHDSLYGLPGYYGFADNGDGLSVSEKVEAADALSFDEMLATYAPDVRALLHSSSYKDYNLGLYNLTMYVYGDVHTTLAYNKYFPDGVPKEGRQVSKKNLVVNTSLVTHSTARNQAGVFKPSGSVKGVFEKLDDTTVVYRFDEFAIDWNGWKAYYAGNPTANPNPEAASLPADSIGSFYRLFYTLEHDSAFAGVKNILIDVSCNDGGEDRAAMFMMGYLADSVATYRINARSGGKQIKKVLADINFDGKFDKNDKKKNYNFAVLTSRASFSSANMFSCLCQDAGIPIIGADSMGGSCAVFLSTTADGLALLYSGFLRVSHTDWSNMETGTKVQDKYKIGSAADFYNKTKLLEMMHSLYP